MHENAAHGSTGRSLPWLGNEFIALASRPKSSHSDGILTKVLSELCSEYLNENDFLGSNGCAMSGILGESRFMPFSA